MPADTPTDTERLAAIVLAHINRRHADLADEYNTDVIASLEREIAADETALARLWTERMPSRSAMERARDLFYSWASPALAVQIFPGEATRLINAIADALTAAAQSARDAALEEAATVVDDMPVQIYRDEGIGPAGQSCKATTFDDIAAAIRSLMNKGEPPQGNTDTGGER